MKLSRHARTELLIASALALGSCDNFSTPFSSAEKERLETAYAQSIEGARASSAMVDRVERLESRVEQIEDKLKM